MAPQSVDLDLRLGLGILCQFQTSSWYSGGSVRADQDVGVVDEERWSSLNRTGSRSSGINRGNVDKDVKAGKKLRLSRHQAAVLEDCFKSRDTLAPEHKHSLANSLGLRPRQVGVWFQNRRARAKLKQTDVDLAIMKRRCEQVAEQNRRLKKEVTKLRNAQGGIKVCISCQGVITRPPLFETSSGFSPLVPLPLPEHRQIFKFSSAVGSERL